MAYVDVPVHRSPGAEPGVADAQVPLPAGGGRDRRLRVGILDRDSGFLEVLTRRLTRLGWEHEVYGEPDAIGSLHDLRAHAVVVNPAAVGLAGCAWLERVTAELPALVVVVCTGRATVGERVHALRAGADDWIMKPCHPEEVIARVEAAVRRGARVDAPPAERLSAGELEIHADQYQAFVAGRSLGLTRRECELISALAADAGRVLERGALYRRVWGYEMAHGDRSVDVFVRKLRQKLQRASPSWRYIHTHQGVGYRFAAEPRSTQDRADEPRSPSFHRTVTGR